MVTSIQSRLNLSKAPTPDQNISSCSNTNNSATIIALNPNQTTRLTSNEQTKYEQAKQAINQAAKQLNW